MSKKEIKKLIKEMKEWRIERCHVPYYEFTFLKEEFELLLDYINQLETSRDKTIGLVEKQLLSNSNYTGYTDEMCLKDLLEILKGDDK